MSSAIIESTHDSKDLNAKWVPIRFLSEERQRHFRASDAWNVYDQNTDCSRKELFVYNNFTLYKAHEPHELKDCRVRSTVYGDMWEDNGWP